MSALYWHPTTNRQLDLSSRALPHALLVFGNKGAGVTAAARLVAEKTAGTATVSLVEPEGAAGAITIDTVRQLYSMTRSDLGGRHLVIMDEADRMTQEAQNSLLKLLEEPSGRTSFILTSHRPGWLMLPIVSRCQQLLIRPLTRQQARSLLTEAGINEADLRRRILLLGDGLAAELSKLSYDAAYRRDQFERAALAKSLLAGSRLDRLIAARKIAGDRQSAVQTLEIAARLLRPGLAAGQETAIDRLESLLDACERLQKNALIRLQMLKVAF